jgi:hypothetical protein
MNIERFEDVEAWQLARKLTQKVYRLTKKPGFAKDYGLKKQIQDAAVSSMHNIAEGFDSETNPAAVGLFVDSPACHARPEIYGKNRLLGMFRV